MRPVLAGILLFVCLASVCSGLDLVLDGKPAAVIVVAEDAPVGKGFPSGDRQAAETLVAWVELMTDAVLPIAAAAGQGPAVYVGLAARRAGLDVEGIPSASSEGLRTPAAGFDGITPCRVRYLKSERTALNFRAIDRLE